ncbi:MAG: sodium:proton antiporter [Polyangiaceae bacterium]|nr:sodium:proton antiporter [Polyangiaceae bacterium]MCW5791808.1 sodium:proton antiporter [Polyangiaceae bacterium]
MEILNATAILLILAATFGFLNYHLLKLPFAIGLLLSGLLASLAVLGVDQLIPNWKLAEVAREAVLSINFADTVLTGMLTLLLFAGALHTDLSRLKQHYASIVTLASVGVLISTAVSGVAAYFVFQQLGVPISMVWCLAFGALISPTDPIAVLGIMKAAKAPKSLETKVIGESLFNDGTAVVVFTVLLGIGVAMATGSAEATEEAMSPLKVGGLLVQEVVGGIALGLGSGWVCARALRTMDEPSLEILVSVATVFAIGLIASKTHVSAPLAAVAAGLFIGNRGRHALSERAARDLDIVWTFIDETLNALLFLLIGLEIFAIDSRLLYLEAGGILVVVVLFARWVGVGLPILVLRSRRSIDTGAIRVLTWGGLKGGVSVALAMKLPEFDGRAAVLTVTYVIVIFSVVVQGLTVGRLIRRIAAESAQSPEEPEPEPGH